MTLRAAEVVPPIVLLDPPLINTPSCELPRAKVPAALLGRPVAAGALIGSPDTIRHQLAELEAAGVQEVILGFPDILQLDSLRFFAQEFIG